MTTTIDNILSEDYVSRFEEVPMNEDVLEKEELPMKEDVSLEEVRVKKGQTLSEEASLTLQAGKTLQPISRGRRVRRRAAPISKGTGGSSSTAKHSRET